MPGKIVHFELPAADADRASGLLERRLRLGVRRQRDGGLRLPDDPDRRRPGRRGLSRPRGQARRSIVYFDTDDIDASIAKVRELGGTADDKQPIPHVGWFAALHGHRGQQLQPLPERRVGRRVTGARGRARRPRRARGLGAGRGDGPLRRADRRARGAHVRDRRAALLSLDDPARRARAASAASASAFRRAGVDVGSAG